jgi:CheY-like chemotaxis protein/HPt (histidine-containing phosphotransfer) domain-containing protein
VLDTPAGSRFDFALLDDQMPGMDGIDLAKRIRQDGRLAAMRLIMLTARDTYESNSDTVQMFAAILTKPLRRSQLLNCVTRAMAQVPETGLEDTAIHPVLAASARAFVPKILLVEDNPVNREVAVGMLETLGCVAHSAENGRLALDAINNHAYDAVLMDCHMPIMDGLAATAELRLREQNAGGARLPIIALTANAMTGDRELCEAAGMDGYLTKPIEVERLRNALTKFGLAKNEAETSTSAASAAAAPPAPAGHARPPVDLSGFKTITGGDDAFAQELAATFIASGEQQLAELTEAVRAVNRPALARAAHQLKGACANIHAHALKSLAERVETESAAGDARALEHHNAQLREEFERVKQFLSDPAVIPQAARAAS